MLLCKAAIMAEHRLHVRYDQAWQPGASLLDLYELITTCVAARSIPVDLSILQRLVISPLWRALGYTIKYYMRESTFMCLVDMQDSFPSRCRTYQSVVLTFSCCIYDAQLQCHVQQNLQLYWTLSNLNSHPHWLCLIQLPCSVI